MWSSTQIPEFDNGDGMKRRGVGGVHPFILVETSPGDFIGIYFNNANA